MNNKDFYFSYLRLLDKLRKYPLLFRVLHEGKGKYFIPIYSKFWKFYRKETVLLKSKMNLLNNNEKKILSLKNTHLGEKAFIIGNGPSLNANDLERIKKKGFFSFGANRINLIYDKTSWRPDCYLAIDIFLFRDNDPTMNIQINEDLPYYFVSKKLYNCIPSSMRPANMMSFELLPKSDFYETLEFSENPMEYMVNGETVTYISIQLAKYMGFSEIYLLGVDCNYSKIKKKDGTIVDLDEKEPVYFDKNYDPKRSNFSKVDDMLASYSYAEEYSKHYAFRIYNATRGGKLEMFERVDIDSILA